MPQRPHPIPEPTGDRGRLLSFYEAYFSNFIEGTELDLDDAEAVVFHGAVLDAQPEDSHDVAATFKLVSSDPERSRVPATADELEDLLLERHRTLLTARPLKHPGLFKTTNNRAGATSFVAPDLVRGTLRAGWAHIDSLDEPFHRAVAMMFVVAEIHPFDDGNGRIARIMMNAELSAARECRIIVPAVYRSEYLSALNAPSNNHRPSALERVLAFAQRWTSQIDWSHRPITEADLTATNAFINPVQAVLDGTKLRLPTAVPADQRDAAFPNPTQPTRPLN